MDRAADLWTLVSNLKNAAYDEPVHILQMLGDKLINDCRIEVFGVTIEPLWVEAYCYDETHFPDYNTHRSRKQKNRFGQMYFHERGYGGVDICLSNSEDFCLSFLLKATLANGHFLTQTQLPRVLLSTGKTKLRASGGHTPPCGRPSHHLPHDPCELGQTLLQRRPADLICAGRNSQV